MVDLKVRKFAPVVLEALDNDLSLVERNLSGYKLLENVNILKIIMQHDIDC